MLDDARSTVLARGVPVALAALLLCVAASASAVSFQGLGDLAGDDFQSFGFAMSADGSVVVGESHSGNGNEAFRWNVAMSGLGDLPLGIFDSTARATSSDGSVVVGFGDTATGREAFTWNTTTQTLTPLGSLLLGGESRAFGVSGDGLTAVGSSDSALGLQAVRWQGAPVGLGDLAGGAFRSQALAVSGDGLTIVGDSDATNGSEAFIWQGLMVGLGDLAGGGFDSQAFGVSPDGGYVVGRGESGAGDEAFLWQSGPGMQGLGDLAGGIFSSTAFDVTDAGRVVGSASGASGPEAFVWDSGTMLRLIDVLVANGLATEVAGWTLTEARAVSDDGLTFAGFGTNPAGDTEAWIASVGVLPEPSGALLLGTGLALLAVGRSRREPGGGHCPRWARSGLRARPRWEGRSMHSCSVLLFVFTLFFAGAAQGTAVGPVTELFGPGDFNLASTVIDFDDAADAMAANTLYLAQGIEFQNTGAPVPIIDWAGIPRVTTSSPNVIATEDDWAGTGSEFSTFLDLLFTSPTLEVGAYFGNDQGIQPIMQMQLSVFDVSDALIGSVLVDVNQNTSVDQFAGLRSDSTPFYRARFENILAQGDLSVVLDDVQFTSPVPEPSSLVLVGCGLGLLAQRRRRATH